MNIKEKLKKKSVRPYVLAARFGIEKENQRSTFDGYLARTDHPAVLGNRSFHPYIQTDFSETQLELITPVVDNAKDVLRYLAAIHDVTRRSLAADEMLWPLSMPPILPEKDEEIKIAKLEQYDAVLYRRYLAKEYGKRKQMVSGIHFNFEFAQPFLQQLFAEQTEIEDSKEFSNQLYMKVARNFLRYRWLITYLFGASPVSEDGYFKNDLQYPQEPVRSIRNSSYGYTNHENVKVSYASLERYLEDIHRMVENGFLSEEKEFYTPVRLRGGEKLTDLPQTGIRYIEVRNIDLNPFASLGIDRETIDFLHYFMLYLLWTDEKEQPDDWAATGKLLNEQIALGHPHAAIKLVNEGERIFTEIIDMLEELELPEAKETVNAFYQQLRRPETTVAGKMWTIIEGNSNRELGMIFGREYQTMAFDQPYQLAGFREMELSTQLLLFDTIQKGIRFDILDEKDQFLKLQHKDHIEYVKNANMTSKDNYIVPLIMENKTITKKVLTAAGFNVPAGAEFTSLAEAQQAHLRYAKKAFVVKPKRTNYGLGITIFKNGASLADFKEAITIAFKEDQAILIEEFLPGTEYRFFVIDNQVKAIMLRIPVNVVGDGVQTIEELVVQKNLDPLRGTDHRVPLELIQLGEVETLMLKEQNLTPTSVPKKNQVVYLRENSNISTGGDSIDVTDSINDSYKQIAIAAVKALGAKICGIDLIIPDENVQATKDSQAYGIIEANFNPAMHMHIYPYKGQSRRLTMDVLKLLYPELFPEHQNATK